MLTLVVGEQKIRACQEKLEEILNKKLSFQSNYRIGYQGAAGWLKEKIIIKHNSQIWYFSCEDGEKEKSSYRFWNALWVGQKIRC